MEAKKMIMRMSNNSNEKQYISKEEEEEDDDKDVALPGFRFHPTDEELVGFYLRRKVDDKPLSIELIKQIDIYKYDPWDLPKIGNVGDKEWYFFCIRGRKYRNSIRPNRVTGSGFWKATGIDKPIYSAVSKVDDQNCRDLCIGLKKSLVYYRGSAGKGTKTDWMMHEFRLPPTLNPINSTAAPSDDNANVAQEAEVWTLCRIFKRMPSYKKYNNLIPTNHSNNNNNNVITSLDIMTPQNKSSSILSSLSTTTPVDDSSSKTCSLENDYNNNDQLYHVSLELNPQESLFSQQNKRSKTVDDRDCETTSTITATTTTRESWFNLGQYNNNNIYMNNGISLPQIALPHHQASTDFSGLNYYPNNFSLNPNPPEDHDNFLTNGSWDELTSVVQLAVDRSNPSQLHDILDKLQH